MHLSELMNTDVETIGVRETAESALNRMRIRGIHHLVAMEDGKVSGVVSERDLGGRKGNAPLDGLTVADVMTPHVVSATPETTLREAANLLRGYMIGCLPILKDGKLKGIVTITDLLNLFGRGTQMPRRIQFRRAEWRGALTQRK